MPPGRVGACPGVVLCSVVVTVVALCAVAVDLCMASPPGLRAQAAFLSHATVRHAPHMTAHRPGRWGSHVPSHAVERHRVSGPAHALPQHFAPDRSAASAAAAASLGRPPLLTIGSLVAASLCLAARCAVPRPAGRIPPPDAGPAWAPMSGGASGAPSWPTTPLAHSRASSPRPSPPRAASGDAVSEGRVQCEGPFLLPPKSSGGEALAFVLRHRPRGFEEVLGEEVERLCEERMRQRRERERASGFEAVLRRRIQESVAQHQREAVEDVLYFYVCRQFGLLGVPPLRPPVGEGDVMLPESQRDALLVCAWGSMCSPSTTWSTRPLDGPLHRLCSPLGGVHSPQVCEIVLAFISNMLRRIAVRDRSVRGSHVAAMYTEALLFGYQLRRADKRFGLLQNLGMVPGGMSDEETILLLLESYNSADAESQDPDGPSAVPQRSTGPPPTLVEYMDAFTADVQNGTSHLKSLETLNVVEGYARALWGDAPQLLRNAGDPSESRVPRKRNDVPPPKVDTPTLSVGGGQRILLEAVAFGAFLRDAERHLELTAPAPLFTPNPRKPPVPP